MDASFINNITEAMSNFCKWLFESYAGISVLVGACLLITLLIAVILEVKTKNKFKNYPEEEEEEEENDKDEQ